MNPQSDPIMVRIPLNPDTLSKERLLFDVQETPSHYLLRLDVHSVLGNEISLDISGETLTLKDRPSAKGGSAVKRITLRVDSHYPAVSASYRGGLLIIALPKEKSNPVDGIMDR